MKKLLRSWLQRSISVLFQPNPRFGRRQHYSRRRLSTESLETRLLLVADFGDAPFGYPTLVGEVDSGAEWLQRPGLVTVATFRRDPCREVCGRGAGGV